MKKAMRSELALVVGAGFDAEASSSRVSGAGSASGVSDASAIGDAEPRHIPDRVSGTRLTCATKEEDNARVALLLRTHFRDVWRIGRASCRERVSSVV